MPKEAREFKRRVSERARKHGFDLRKTESWALVNDGGHINLYPDLRAIELMLDDLEKNLQEKK